VDLGVDLRSEADVGRAVEGAEAVVHLAAVLGRRGDSDEDFIQVNVVGTWRLLTAAIGAGVRRIVDMSSMQALGVFEGQRAPDYLPLDDDHPCYPATPYAVSKHLGEVLCADLQRSHGLETVVLRPPAIWTEETYARVKAKRAQDPSYEWRPFWEYGAFIDVRDLVAAIAQALVVDYPGPRPLAVVADDINSSGPTSREWAARVHPDVPWRGDDRFVAEPYKTLVDNSRTKALLRWRPRHSWRPRHA
jgi:nucleoside-diphosphate-sugar epimerase